MESLQQGLNRVVLNMLQEGIELELIVKLTGLPLERLQNLQAINEDDDHFLIKDFMELSESPLNKIWLDQEEEAWKEL